MNAVVSKELNGHATLRGAKRVISGLSQLDRDILLLPVKETMQVHGYPQPHNVYDRKVSLAKAFKKAGISQDKALKLPLVPEEQGITSRTIAAPLKPATVKMEKPQGSHRTHVTVDNSLAAFEVEHNPPPFSSNIELQLFYTRLDKTVENWNVNGAIVIDAKRKVAALKHLRHSFPKDRWATAKINGNDNQVRIYRLALLPK